MKKYHNDKLYKKCKKLKLSFNHVMEIGVDHPKYSNMLGFINDGIKTELVEPNPASLKYINETFKEKENVIIHPFAIFNKRGKIGLYNREGSTFAKELEDSPAISNDNYIPDEKDLFYADAKLMSDIDDGTIDLLAIDIEGAEWMVIQNLISKPVVLSIETGCKKYKNPNLDKINEWISQNNYKLWYKDGSDSVFIRSEIMIPYFQKIF